MDEFELRWRGKTEEAKTNGVSPSAKLAKLAGERYYLGDCKRHGEMLFLACDNSCPMCTKAAREIRNATNPKFNRARGHYNEIKKRSTDNGYEFDLTLDWFREQLSTINVCPVLNVPIASNTVIRDDSSISVDKYDCNKGYTVENVRFISDRANRIKNDGTAAEHLLVAKYMIEDPAVKQQIDALLELLQSTKR